MPLATKLQFVSSRRWRAATGGGTAAVVIGIGIWIGSKLEVRGSPDPQVPAEPEVHTSAVRAPAIEEPLYEAPLGLFREKGLSHAEILANAPFAEAHNSLYNGNYTLAISQARQLIKINPVLAWHTIGDAACHLKDASLASEAYRHLVPERQRYLIYICRRAGLTKQGSQFKPIKSP